MKQASLRSEIEMIQPRRKKIENLNKIGRFQNLFFKIQKKIMKKINIEKKENRKERDK